MQNTYIENNPIIAIVRIFDDERILRRSFFSSNVNLVNVHCKKCDKGPLAKNERVDCEFWPNDIETYCIECWAKAFK